MMHYAIRCLAIAMTSAAMAGCIASTPASDDAIAADGTRAEIAVLETTDLHSNVMSYDFYKLADDQDLGLERAATLIHDARKEFTNTLLFDDGDTIQGTALADYQALVKPPACDQELAVYKAMDTLDYDAGTIGNHEFNYGLAYLSQVTGTPFNVAGVDARKCKGPHYPFVLSNVFSAKDGKPLYAPWRLLTRTIHVHAPDGSDREATIRIGLLGFAPPPIMDWDRRNLEGKVTVMGVVEAAEKYLPELHKAGADIVIAIAHGGINAAPYTPKMENAGWYLAQVPGIDAILLGHSHDIFPNPGDPKSHYAHIADVDKVRGSVHGVPAVMGNYFGKSIGLIDLVLVHDDGRWQVDRAATHAEVRSVKNADGSHVAADAEIIRLVKPEHDATIAYVKTPVGRSDFEMSTYFAADRDTTALQVVNAAQRDYVEKYIKENLPQYAGIAVLSAAAPFKAGFGGPNDYTDIAAGPLAINNAADLYLYPNTLTAVKTDGAGIRAWLEKSAGWFNRIDPAKTGPQELVNRRFPTYNFDVLQGGLTYTIDVTQAEGGRIRDLRYNDQAIDADRAFIVVTNNYRASGGGRFPGLDGKNIVISAPDSNRDALIAFIRAAGEITRVRFGNDRNWRFAAVKTAGPVIFTSAAGKLDLARADGLDNVTLWKDNGDGTAVYAVDLSR
ncbi:MAG: bifunctional 2',3'-cyclic-nucleotide 2'-phosphodiesterase/3'-nucleotidase [Rudaea sp.]|nr:bifunctional 2',3'-cyclic-nucleotide 2'-phosphodiesterase/3'-nucleotidase [Rudaea sp.]